MAWWRPFLLVFVHGQQQQKDQPPTTWSAENATYSEAVVKAETSISGYHLEVAEQEEDDDVSDLKSGQGVAPLLLRSDGGL